MIKNFPEILKEKEFRFNRQFGQNFIFDTNLLRAIAVDGMAENSEVLEIGAGAGSLTRVLSGESKRVVAVEIDKNLKPILSETLSGLINVELIIGDIQKISDEEIRKYFSGEFRIIANLPYYISAPLIMRFLESDLPVKSITVMVQQEVAERFLAKPRDKNYGAITVSASLYGKSKITRKVSRKMFRPEPNVDSAILRVEKDCRFEKEDRKGISDFVKRCFSMRRKTLLNNLMKDGLYSKEDCIFAIEKIGKGQGIRAEELKVEEFIELFNLIKNRK